MTPIDERLLQVEIVNNEVITEMRESIHSRYETATQKQKASILAKTIHKIIDESLPNFSMEIKENIRTVLIRRNLHENSLTINANDIVASSIEVAPPEEIEEELSLWMKNTVKLDLHTIESYMFSIMNLQGDNEVALAEYPDQTEIIEQSLFQVNEKAPVPIRNKFQNHRSYLLGVFATFFIVIPIIIGIDFILPKNSENVKGESIKPKVAQMNEVVEKVERSPNELPSHLQYELIDYVKLRAWLDNRNSLLSDEPYFSTIIKTADEFNVHPLLLFAITGQEQGFVKRNNTDAEKMANNPFNVYHSWKEFNTSIQESSRIAARTIVNLSKDRPEEVHPIQWINRKYAEDPNWWLGVSSIFDQLESVVQ